MKIKIDLKIFIFFIIFILTKQVKVYTVLMIFALIHEIGHLLAGLLLGFKPESIKIALYGFQLRFKVNYDDYNSKINNGNKLSLKMLLIAIAGPFINLVIIILSLLYFYVIKESYFLNVSLETIIYSNLLILLFNLLPIYPLDGGRIIKEIIHIKCGLNDSYKLTNKISNIFLIVLTVAASIIIIFYRNIAIIITLLYLWIINIKRNKIFENKEKIIDLICCKKNK